jgi:hypothetical protein
MSQFMKQSQGAIFLAAAVLSLFGLATSEDPQANQESAPVISAESDRALVESAQPVYDGRRVRAEAEVIRQSGQSFQSSSYKQPDRDAEAQFVRTDCPGGVCPLQKAVSRVHSSVIQAQTQGYYESHVYRERQRSRSGGLFPNRPRLFKR